MSTSAKKPFRKRHLFARTVNDVVKEATKPLMSKQGKLYGALLRDWAQIVGPERARVTRPDRLQFMNAEATGAILHISARPSAAPELTYAHEQILEQCARYFGYRAIDRLVIHATHEGFTHDAPAPSAPTAESVATVALPTNLPNEMRHALERLSKHLTSPSDKK